MQNREKKLAIALGATLVVAFALPMFESWFLQPITDATNRLTAAQSEVDKLIDQESILAQARRDLDNWQYESLPPDPYTAQREYQEWLLDVARMSRFSNPVPTLGNIPTRGRTYVEVPVTIEAKATFEQLARFLYHFERVALLHRVHTLDVTSPASIGDPLFDVTIAARGLSLIDAPVRTRLFPTTSLREDVTADEETLIIEGVKGFPKIDGYQVKIDEELLTVRKQSVGTLTVERGAEQTRAVAHAAGSLVELFPLDRVAFQNGRTFEDYVSLLENSPFTKPSPPVDYDPKLSPTSEQVVTRGEPWKLKLSLSSWDPAGGPAVYELDGEVPRGLEINAQSGELSWEAGDAVEAGTYEVAVVARSDILSGQQASMMLPVRLREPNLPPIIAQVDPLKAFSGRPITEAIQADDPDGPNDKLKFAVQGDVPAGVTIDEATGELKWIPPLTLELGEYKVEIAVTDSGDPAQTATQQVSATLEDDAALFTRLVGIFRNGGEPEVMLNNLTTGETTRLTLGAKLNAADVAGTIIDIKSTHVLLDVDGQTFKLSMGKNLRQLMPVEPDEAPAPDSSSE